MASSIPKKVKGMRDVFESDIRRARSAISQMETVFLKFGYQPVETPILEQTDLFLRKTGGDLAAQMYSFPQQGGNRIALRPECTSPIIRLFLEQEQETSLPVRWQYTGPVFRHHPLNDDGPRQFTQIGAELIGESSSNADGEILALSLGSIQSVVPAELTLTLGNIGVLQRLLEQFDISERAVLFFLNAIGPLSDGGDNKDIVRQQGQRVGIFSNGNEEANLSQISSYLSAIEKETLQSGNLPSPSGPPPGGRSPKQIIERLHRKIQNRDENIKLDPALSFISQIAQVHGAPTEALNEAMGIASMFQLDDSPFSDIKQTIDRLAAYTPTNVGINVNFGLARGIAYYTGLIFEIQRVGDTKGLILGAGGRYDGLVKALGGSVDIPALGFACSIEAILESINGTDRDSGTNGSNLLTIVIPSTPDAMDAAVNEAQELRKTGRSVEIMFKNIGQEETLTRNARTIVKVDSEGNKESYDIPN